MDGGNPDSLADDVTILEKLLKSPSLVSAPVFFVLGDPSEANVPSPKDGAVFILSEQVEDLRERLNKAGTVDSELVWAEVDFGPIGRVSELKGTCPTILGVTSWLEVSSFVRECKKFMPELVNEAMFVWLGEAGS